VLESQSASLSRRCSNICGIFQWPLWTFCYPYECRESFSWIQKATIVPENNQTTMCLLLFVCCEGIYAVRAVKFTTQGSHKPSSNVWQNTVDKWRQIVNWKCRVTSVKHIITYSLLIICINRVGACNTFQLCVIPTHGVASCTLQHNTTSEQKFLENGRKLFCGRIIIESTSPTNAGQDMILQEFLRMTLFCWNWSRRSILYDLLYFTNCEPHSRGMSTV